MEKRKGHTKLYSNDHDNRIYFQDLTEILEEMNGPDFKGSMGYAELCVEMTLKNHYDIDINNGPVNYDPDIDYRALLTDLGCELEFGRTNAINVGFEDIAAYYEDIRLRIDYKESDHITNQDFSSQWRKIPKIRTEVWQNESDIQDYIPTTMITAYISRT